MINIGFVGCGNMGTAMATALSVDKNNKIFIYSRNFQKNEIFSKTINSIAVKTLKELLNISDYVILAIKPQVLPSIYEDLNNLGKNKIYISLAAGVTIKTLEDKIGSKNIVRFMPNIGAKNRASVTAVAFSETLNENIKNTALNIAYSFGKAFVIEERLFSAFIGISGSAIAYDFEFLNALALGGTREGIAYQQSLEIAISTLKSAISLVENGENPESQLIKVISAGGTTIEGINALHQGNFDATVINAVHAAAQKSLELEKKV